MNHAHLNPRLLEIPPQFSILLVHINLVKIITSYSATYFTANHWKFRWFWHPENSLDTSSAESLIKLPEMSLLNPHQNTLAHHRHLAAYCNDTYSCSATLNLPANNIISLEKMFGFGICFPFGDPVSYGSQWTPQPQKDESLYIQLNNPLHVVLLFHTMPYVYTSTNNETTLL